MDKHHALQLKPPLTKHDLLEVKTYNFHGLILFKNVISHEYEKLDHYKEKLVFQTYVKNIIFK
jgi:uncharacterized protein YutE (UPF0331/DUF86 family)